MKRGTEVKISEYVKGTGNGWGNDEYSGEITLKPGDVLYHSSKKEIKTFSAGFTCFYLNDYIRSGFVYGIKIEKEMKVKTWNCKEEVRIDLDSEKIVYLGKCTVKYDYTKTVCTIDNHGRKNYGPKVTIIDNTIKL